MPYLPSYLHTLHFGMQMCHLSSLPHIYSSVFTFLRYICMEQICANPFFRPVKVARLWTSYKSSTGSFFHFLPLLQLSLLKPDNSSFGAVYDKLKRESSFKVLLGNSPNSRHVKPELGVWSDKTSRVSPPAWQALTSGCFSRLLLVFANITCFLRCLSLYRGCLSLYERR